MFKILLISAIVLSSNLHAQRNPPSKGPPTGNTGENMGVNPACVPVRAACEKAGFRAGRGRGGEVTTGNGQSKGSIRDCMTRWAAGEAIPGISIKSTEPAGKICVDHMNRMKDRRSGARGGMGDAGPGSSRGRPGPRGAMGPGSSRAGLRPAPPGLPPPAAMPVAPALPPPSAPAPKNPK